MIATLLWDRGATCGDRDHRGLECLPSFDSRVTCFVLCPARTRARPDRDNGLLQDRLQTADCRLQVAHTDSCHTVPPQKTWNPGSNWRSPSACRVIQMRRLQLGSQGFPMVCPLPTRQSSRLACSSLEPCTSFTRSLLDCRFQFPDRGSSPVVTRKTDSEPPDLIGLLDWR